MRRLAALALVAPLAARARDNATAGAARRALRREAAPAGLRFAADCFARTRVDERMDVAGLRALAPAEYAAHRALVWEATRGWRGVKTHYYGGYGGPWVENWWIATFSGRPDESFGGLVPVFAQWTDGGVHKDKAGPGAVLQELAAVARDDVACVRRARSSRAPLVRDADTRSRSSLLNFAPPAGT